MPLIRTYGRECFRESGERIIDIRKAGIERCAKSAGIDGDLGSELDGTKVDRSRAARRENLIGRRDRGGPRGPVGSYEAEQDGLIFGVVVPRVYELVIGVGEATSIHKAFLITDEQVKLRAALHNR